MFKLLLLILRNLGRNKLRALLTAAAVVVLATIYSFVSTVYLTTVDLIAQHASETRLLVRERWIIPPQFPVRYVSKIATIEGIEDWTVWHVYAGKLKEWGMPTVGFATQIENIREMHAGLETLDDQVIDALRREKIGALMGARTMKQMDWQVGQKFTLLSSTHPGKNLEFKIVGELPSDQWPSNFFFREDYFREAVGDKGNVSVMWLQVRDSKTSPRVAKQIETLFENAPVQLKVETESAGVARFAGRSTVILNILQVVVVILLLDMAFILANSISMTVRERRSEMAILKVLGFQPRIIVALVVGEAVLVGMVAGMTGTALAFAVSELNLSGQLPIRIDILLAFPVPAWLILHGLGLGALVGVLGSVGPALSAQKVSVANILGKVT